MYLFDVDTGTRIERFLTDDPVEILTKILPGKKAAYHDFIVRIERMDIRGDVPAELTGDAPKSTKKASKV